ALSRPCTAARAPSRLTGTFEPSSEERRKEVGEGILIAEEIVHLLLGHRAEAALRSAAPDVPSLAGERVRGTLLLGLFVHPPVGAQLVVLPPLLRIAEHLVGLVDLFEPALGRLVAGVHVGVVFAGELAVGLLQFLLRG